MNLCSRRTLSSLVIALALMGFAAQSARAQAQWPGWLGPNRDGKSPDKGLLKEWPAEGPKLLWQVEGLGKGFSSPAVTSDTVYISGETGGKLVLFAFDLEGKPKWKVDAADAWKGDYDAARSSPVVDGGLVYLLSGGGTIGCFDAQTGAKKWSHTMQEFGGNFAKWGYAESVLIYDDLAIVTPGGKNCIVALNKTTGETVWKSAAVKGGAQYGSCLAFTFDNTPMIVQGTSAGLFCVDAKTGALLWSNTHCANRVANCPTPAYADGYVFWANGYGQGGVCMKLEAGGKAKEAWATKDMDCHHGGYIIDNGLIYGNTGDGWACLDLKTGDKKWQDKGVGKGSICYADGMLYLLSENGGNCALATCSPEGLKITGKVSVKGHDKSWAHPVVIGGRLYLRYADNLYCYDVKAK